MVFCFSYSHFSAGLLQKNSSRHGIIYDGITLIGSFRDLVNGIFQSPVKVGNEKHIGRELPRLANIPIHHHLVKQTNTSKFAMLLDSLHVGIRKRKRKCGWECRPRIPARSSRRCRRFEANHGERMARGKRTASSVGTRAGGSSQEPLNGLLRVLGWWWCWCWGGHGASSTYK
jgi:hypothetical protein